MKKKLLYSLLFGMFAVPSIFAADYGLPAGIQEGNILHCFNWPAKEVKAALPQIAAAGFGSVQLSPLQRGDVSVGSPWHDLYRPYDLAFKPSGYCSEQDLKDLCSAAAEYGIKIIVDVVANHVDKTAGYHDTWWDGSGRVRWNGAINYGDRYSITHGQLGDYGDINSEDAEVANRAKAYVEKLKSLGVSGCRWDAAKHIGLPSEGCNFWSTVTSVPGMYHYGEILDAAGPNAGIIKEYTNYMSVTDNKYSNGAARENGGIAYGFGGDHVANNGCPDTKMVYWGESHDTYSNDEWSQNVDQSVIDRAYACYACRNGATALYLSRPNAKGFSNIKVGKGSTAFTGKHIAEVNKFRNAMVGRKDWCEAAGNTFTVTRQDGGAVIVMKGSGNVSVTNGGGYCPAGTYTDRVSGGTFTVTASSISGNVGSSGIAVLIKDGLQPNPTPNPDPNPTPNPDPTPTPGGGMYILGNLEGAAGWAATPGTGVAMTLSNGNYVANGVKMVTAAGETSCYFNLADYVGATWDDLNMNANRYGAATEGAPITLGTAASVVKYANNVDASGCLSWTIPAGSYDITFNPSAMTLTVVNAGTNPTPNPDPNPTPNPTPGTLTIPGDYNLAYSGDKANVHYWGGSAPSSWPGVTMTTATGSDGRTYKVAKIDASSTGLLFNTNGDESKTGDLTYTAGFVYNDNGATSTAVTFGSNPNPNPNPDPTPTPGDDHYIYYDGTFTTPTVWAWTTGNVSCNSNTTWPGDAMTKKDGKWYWAVPSGKSVPTMLIISENGGEKLGGAGTAEGEGDLVYVDKATYHQDATYTVGDNPNPNPNPDPIPDPNPGPTPNPTPTPSGDVLNTDYYRVNPDGKVGRYRSVNMSFNGLQSTTALSNWSDADLIAQGVGRDICQAFKGLHERPIVDSYAIYASYDDQNLYLGVQMVYGVWDEGGEGKQPGESKPYNMDGRMVWAFDLDPNASFDGYIDGVQGIWNDTNAPGIKFANGVDAMWIGSTKPGVGTPGFFVPTPDGHASYESPTYCKPSTVTYGYQDGLLPSITNIWAQPLVWGATPDALTGNAGWVDMRGDIDDSAHTFYEFKFPLSLLGVTRNYIETNGIGVQYIDVYGCSGVGGTPYDPAYFDNAMNAYSKDPSSSQEKEDEDVLTYMPARVGYYGHTSAIDSFDAAEAAEATAAEYFTLEGLRVDNPTPGLYIVVRGSKVTKELVK